MFYINIEVKAYSNLFLDNIIKTRILILEYII